MTRTDSLSDRGIVVVGFGNMGARHTQSLLSAGCRVAVIEPNRSIFDSGCAMIGASNGEIAYFESFSDYLAGRAESHDAAVVATTSPPREQIVLDLVSAGCRKLLLEKVVFQRTASFDRVLAALSSAGAEAYVNHVNRYFSNYTKIKEQIDGGDAVTSVQVLGGRYGLASNALHYLDLTEWLSGTRLSPHGSDLSEIASRRDGFREVTGSSTWRGSSLQIQMISGDTDNTDVVVRICLESGTQHVIMEAAGNHFVLRGGKAGLYDFCARYTSELTSQLVSEMYSGECILPTVEDSRHLHEGLFGDVNPALGLSLDASCPIT
jgi:predicted dehydrogenase